MVCKGWVAWVGGAVLRAPRGGGPAPVLVDVCRDYRGAPPGAVPRPPPHGLLQRWLRPARGHVLQLVVPVVFRDTPRVLLQRHLCDVAAVGGHCTGRPVLHRGLRGRWRLQNHPAGLCCPPRDLRGGGVHKGAINCANSTHRLTRAVVGRAQGWDFHGPVRVRVCVWGGGGTRKHGARARTGSRRIWVWVHGG